MKIEVLAGDFERGTATVNSNAFLFKLDEYESGFIRKTEEIGFDQLDVVEIATEDNVKRIGGTIGWGVVTGLALGVVSGGLGLIGLGAGMLCGGRGKNITFVARFKDGRKLLAKCDSKHYPKLLAACFK